MVFVKYSECWYNPTWSLPARRQQEVLYVIALKTQTSTYWQDEFVISDDDLEYLHQLIIAEESPVPTETLVAALMTNRCQKEIDVIRADLDKGEMYQPKDHYEVGQVLLFPAFNFAAATVTDSRPGYDPAIVVICALMTGADEFAA